MYNAPERADFFKFEVESFEFLGSCSGFKACGDDVVLEVKHEVVQPLSQGEALAFWEAGGAVEGPVEEFFSDGENGRRDVLRHG